MGPTILLDKSTLQSLSKKELVILNKYYFLNVPPILLHEIKTDLSKKTITEEKVTEIANKIIQKDSAINIDWIFHTNPTSDSTENLPLVPLKTSHFFS